MYIGVCQKYLCCCCCCGYCFVNFKVVESTTPIKLGMQRKKPNLKELAMGNIQVMDDRGISSHERKEKLVSIDERMCVCQWVFVELKRTSDCWERHYAIGMLLNRDFVCVCV